MHPVSTTKPQPFPWSPSVLQTMFGRIPADTGAGYIVIVHLAPEYESHLAEIIGACARMSIVTVND